MKVLILLWLGFWSFGAQAESSIAQSFAAAECSLFHQNRLIKKQSQKFMTLLIDEELARFIQIQFGDDKLKIQYQLLIEPNLKAGPAYIVLQNLMIGESETSVERGITHTRLFRAVNKDFQVRCRVQR